MQAFVYASQRKANTYVWLRGRDCFDVLPESLRDALGELRFVLEVDLDAGRQLPRENPHDVLAHLHSKGWHLQMPPVAAGVARPRTIPG